MTGQRQIGEQFDTVLAAAREGAEWAWARIYDELAPSVLGYLRSRSAPDADAVCGDVFCQLVRDINKFEGDEAGFRSWVFVMAHHRLLDDLRRRKRRPEDSAPPEAFGTLQAPDSVEDKVVGQATEDALRRIMDEITPAQRDVLLLRIFGGLKIEEIADAMGKRIGAVKALQRRGLEALRERLVASGAYPSAGNGR